MSNFHQVIDELRAMHGDMQRLGVSAIEPQSVKSANLPECLEIVKALAGRVSELTGCAGYLDDAAAEIEREIERNEPHDPLCKCDSCYAERSDSNYDRKRDKALMEE